MYFYEMLSLLWSGNHTDFETVLESKAGTSVPDESRLKEGDLILRPMDNKGPFYHVGIYCGESEVIDFAGQPDTLQANQKGYGCCSLSLMNGKVIKVGVEIFLQDQMYRVLRLRFAIPEGFRERVKKAMNSRLEYHATSFNCLHFALKLLGQRQLLDKESEGDTMELQNMEEVNKKLI